MLLIVVLRRGMSIERQLGVAASRADGDSASRGIERVHPLPATLASSAGMLSKEKPTVNKPPPFGSLFQIRNADSSEAGCDLVKFVKFVKFVKSCYVDL